jgi:hypothetical protein
MLDVLAFANTLKANLIREVDQLVYSLEDANLEDVPRVQSQIRGLRMAIREIQGLLDQHGREDSW